MAEHANPNSTIQEALNRYLRPVSEGKAAAGDGKNAAAITHFARWFGPERVMRSLRPSDIERYGEETSKSAGEAQKRLESVRGFLAYARKENIVETNLSQHLRLRRTGPIDSGADAAASDRIEMTAEGLTMMQAELTELISRRPQIAEELRAAMADKDFRENAPLDAAREKQAHIEARIRELEGTLKRAVVVETAGDAGGRARMGSKVRLRRLDNDQEVEYTLVGPGEVDARLRRISVQSPVGRAVVNCSPGDEVEVVAPAGVMRYRLEAVES